MKAVRKAVFPVAGLGTRFLPATKAMPKEMLTVVDKPLIQYAVEEAKEAGVEQMIFVTGRGKGALEDHFDIAYELEATMREISIRLGVPDPDIMRLRFPRAGLDGAARALLARTDDLAASVLGLSSSCPASSCGSSTCAT